MYYSSYLFIDCNGNEIYNYRRCSSGWKDELTDHQIYKEGKELGLFEYKGKIIAVGLCGDFWDSRFDYINKISNVHKDIVIWPVYVDYSIADWQIEEDAYAKQTKLFGERVLMINSICKNPRSYGGAFDFYKGKINQRLPYDYEGVLLIEI